MGVLNSQWNTCKQHHGELCECQKADDFFCDCRFSLLTVWSRLLTPLKYYVFENIMEF